MTLSIPTQKVLLSYLYFGKQKKTNGDYWALLLTMSEEIKEY